MGDYKRDSEQDNSMDCPIWGTDDISDEELLKEFEAVKNMTVLLPIPSPSSDEFEKIWARIQEEKAEPKNEPESDQPEHPKVIKPRFGWKRLAAIGLIACLVAGSGCMVAMGTKSYFYRERVRDENNIVYNNDSNKIAVNGEEEAYKAIEDELEINSLKLGFIPGDMDFKALYIDNDRADMEFIYNKQFFYFCQSKSDRETSSVYGGDYDKQNEFKVHNKWIDKDISIESEVLEDGNLRYKASFISKGVYCRAIGIMNKEEFIEIVKRITN